ncbi:MAG: hypothetical protein H6973_19995 [Gammaproteobacteria bacterium]|nr:hypothetical protein [Gammaproteobacteria bacterium]HRX71166.1 hypothetical protein [Candidatus Competibacteraceae bacterium]
MLDPVIEFFEKLITQFSWARLLFIVLVSSLFVSGLVWYESYTGYFRLGRIERSVELLKEVTELQPKVRDTGNEELSNIFKSITGDLERYVSHDSTPFSIKEPYLKAMAAASPWVLFAILLPFASPGGNRAAIAGIALISTPFIVAAAYIPDFERTWVNYLLYPIGQFVILIAAVVIFQNRKKKP